MTQCNHKTRLDIHPELPVDVEFSADDISAEGGAVLLRQVDDRLGLSETFGQALPDDRSEDRVLHERNEQVRQRILQIAQGWEDQNDADSLRHDPVFKTVCEVDIEEGELSSQPTLSRMENAVDERDVERLQCLLFFSWLESVDDDRREITLDVDASCFEGHGQQELLKYCEYMGGHKLHPLLIFDGETGQLITIVARGGGAGDAVGLVGWLELMIPSLKVLHRPDCSVVVRADAGFATPKLYRLLDAFDQTFGQVGYLIGFKRNQVVSSKFEETMQRARRRHQHTGEKVRMFEAFDYQAGSWDRSRTIVGKAEVCCRPG